MPAKINKIGQCHFFLKKPHQLNLPLKDYKSKYSATFGLQIQSNEGLRKYHATSMNRKYIQFIAYDLKINHLLSLTFFIYHSGLSCIAKTFL